MAIQFACPECGRQLRVPDSSVGNDAQCPKCNNVCEVSELYTRVPDKGENPYRDYGSGGMAPQAAFAGAGAHANPYAASNAAASPHQSWPTVLDSDSRTWAMLSHLSSFSGAIIPFGNILGPLIIWLVKRDQSAFVADQAKEALNFQITLLLIGLLGGLFTAITCGMGVFLMFILVPVLLIVGVVFPVIACIKANEGIAYRYPCSWRLIN